MPPPEVSLPGVVVDVNSVDADGGEVVIDPFGHVGIAVLHDGADSDGEVVCIAAVVDDVVLIAYYYLLHIGEYTKRKGAHSTAGASTQTEQFKMKDVTFFWDIIAGAALSSATQCSGF